MGVTVAAVLALAGCSGAGAGEAPEQTLTVLAAASLTDVLSLVADDVETDHPGATVELSFAASSTIVQQVSEGAPADVIALAGPGPLDQLPAELRRSEPAVFTSNRLALAVPPDNPAGVTGVEDLTTDGLRLVVCQAQVPCGEATAALLARLGIDPAVASQERDARATITKVELGEADVGIVYRTDVLAAGERVLGIDLPEAVNVTTDYPILAVSDHELATVFVEEVLSERGQRHLTAAGFVTP